MRPSRRFTTNHRWSLLTVAAETPSLRATSRLKVRGLVYSIIWTMHARKGRGLDGLGTPGGRSSCSGSESVSSNTTFYEDHKFAACHEEPFRHRSPIR